MDCLTQAKAILAGAESGAAGLRAKGLPFDSALHLRFLNHAQAYALIDVAESLRTLVDIIRIPPYSSTEEQEAP